MPQSHLRQYVPRLEVFSAAEPPPGRPHFIRVVHTTGGSPLIGHGFLTINNSKMTVLQTLVTEKQPPLTLTHLWQPSGEHVAKRPHYLMSPYYTERRLNYNLMYIVDHTFGYYRKNLICTCSESSAQAHGTKVRGGDFKHYKISVGHVK